MVQTAVFKSLFNMFYVPQMSQKVEYDDSRQEWALSYKFTIQETWWWKPQLLVKLDQVGYTPGI